MTGGVLSWCTPLPHDRRPSSPWNSTRTSPRHRLHVAATLTGIYSHRAPRWFQPANFVLLFFWALQKVSLFGVWGAAGSCGRLTKRGAADSMLSFHEPQSLYAEATMCAIALIVILYRLCGGKNEWLRTHGLILITYFALGGLAYDELEGWKLMETTYFLMVTVTTVGYGDMCPETPEGKIFTVIYALFGLIFVFAALSPLLDALLWFKDLILVPCTPKSPLETDADGVLDLSDLRQRGNWGFKYYSAVMGPILVFVVGLIIGYTVMDLDAIDSIYWSMITMTTIGYGDLSATSRESYGMLQMAVLFVYLPLAVAALADTLSALGAISTAKSIIFSEADPERLLMAEARGDYGGKSDPNPDETLTEAEFLISVLKDKGIVDELTIQAVRLQFAHIVRHDKSKSAAKTLTDKIVFQDLVAKGRIMPKTPNAPTLTSLSQTIDLVDTKAADGGYAEWRKAYWIPRVRAKRAEVKQANGSASVTRLEPTPSKAPDGYMKLQEVKATRSSPSDRRGSSAKKGEKGLKA